MPFPGKESCWNSNCFQHRQTGKKLSAFFYGTEEVIYLMFTLENALLNHIVYETETTLLILAVSSVSKASNLLTVICDWSYYPWSKEIKDSASSKIKVILSKIILFQPSKHKI